MSIQNEDILTLYSIEHMEYTFTWIYIIIYHWYSFLFTKYICTRGYKVKMTLKWGNLFNMDKNHNYIFSSVDIIYQSKKKNIK